jgi:hypothetical protein
MSRNSAKAQGDFLRHRHSCSVLSLPALEDASGVFLSRASIACSGFFRLTMGFAVGPVQLCNSVAALSRSRAISLSLCLFAGVNCRPAKW